MISGPDFRGALTVGEAAAVRWWLNLGSRLLREFRDTGGVPPGYTRDQFADLSRDLDAALAKAPVYSGTVFRGTAASALWPSYVRELRELVASDVGFEVPHHLSASLAEEIGVGHCYIEPTDQPREISVLLVARVTSSRLLPGFVHRAKDEQEVVLTSGSRFERRGVRQMQSPRPGQEWWRIDLEQVA